MRRRRVALVAVVALAVVGPVGGAQALAVSGGSPVTDPSFGFAAKIAFGDVRACSGALVAPQWVITARSCLSEAGAPVVAGAPARPTTVTVGRLDLITTNGQVRQVNKVVPHPDRNIALVRLAVPALGVAPVVLSSAAPTPGETLRAVGYGRTATEWVPDELHGVDVAVTAVTATGLDVANQDGAGPTTCRGDAGGATVRLGGAGPELVAVHDTSWQGGCLGETETRRNAVEARTDDLVGWIRQNTPSVNCNAAGATAGPGDQGTVVLPADLDGDCRDDLLGQFTDGRLRAYRSGGNLTGEGPLYLSPYPYVGTSWTATDKPRVVTGDVTGDGRSDIIAQYANGDLRAWASTGDLSADYKLFSGASALVGTNWTTSTVVRIVPGDFNGDGRTDLIAQYANGDLRAWASTGDLSADYKLFAGPTALVGNGWTTTAVPRILPGDFNGDGRTDLIAQMSNGELRFWAANGDLSANYKLFASNYRLVGTSFTTSSQPRILTSDIDGDGLTDLVGQLADGTLRAYRSSGDASADFKMFPSPYRSVGTSWTRTNRPRIMFGDVNADGRADLIGQNADGSLMGFASTGDLSADFKLYAGDKGTVGNGWSSVSRVF
ncbi:FG-GAP-like repeat-containing protein [Micromonospora chersina]|uniref:FG-GAP-like repeat-containing protein n=1 Tax=Micromonospora chersina TaxID=47854 RepID=UPI0033FAD361